MDLFDVLTRSSALGISFDRHYQHLFEEESPRHQLCSTKLISDQVGAIVQDAYQYHELTRKLGRLSKNLSKLSSSKIGQKIKQWSHRFKPSHQKSAHRSKSSHLFHLEPDHVDWYIRSSLNSVQQQVEALRKDLSNLNQLQVEAGLLRQRLAQLDQQNQEDQLNRSAIQERLVRTISSYHEVSGELQRIKENPQDQLKSAELIKSLQEAQQKINQMSAELTAKNTSWEQLVETTRHDQDELDRLIQLVDQLEDDLLAKTQQNQANERLLESADQLLKTIEQTLDALPLP